jgi:hypothetical protein
MYDDIFGAFDEVVTILGPAIDDPFDDLLEALLEAFPAIFVLLSC